VLERLVAIGGGLRACAATSTGTNTGAATTGMAFRRWCAPPSRTCARWASNRLDEDPEAEAKLVEILARAASELKKA